MNWEVGFGLKATKMLFDEYSRLLTRFPSGCEGLYGNAVKGNSNLFFSIDKNDFPHVLFEAKDHEQLQDLELKYIDVQFLRRCTLTLNTGDDIERIFTIIKFKDDNYELVRIFLNLIEDAFITENTDYSSNSIRTKINIIIEIFSRLENSINDVVGLWGELKIIHNSKDPEKIARAWCTSKSAKFDFVGKNFVMDVKATTTSRRQHSFSLEQVRPSNDIRSYICSIQIVETRSGYTVGELMDRVLSQIGDNAERSQVYYQCLSKGGADVYRSVTKFSVLPDGSSFAVFDGRDVPAPEINKNEPIFNVRFEADLTKITPLSRQQAKNVLEMD